MCVCFVSPDSVGRHMSTTAMKGAQKPFIESLPEFFGSFYAKFCGGEAESVHPFIVSQIKAYSA